MFFLAFMDQLGKISGFGLGQFEKETFTNDQQDWFGVFL